MFKNKTYKLLAYLSIFTSPILVNAQSASIEKEFGNVEKALIKKDLYSAKVAWMKIRKSGTANNDYRLYHQRARIEIAMKNNKEALDFLKKAIKIAPGSPILYQECAEVYGTLENHDEVIKNLTKVIELVPRSIKGYYERSVAYFNKAKDITDMDLAEKNLELSINDLSECLDLMDRYIASTKDLIQIKRAKTERRKYENLSRQQFELRSSLDDILLNINQNDSKSSEIDENLEEAPKKESEKSTEEGEEESFDDESFED